MRSVETVFRYYTIPLVRVEIKDFDTGNWIDLASLPTNENVAVITLCSYSEKIGDLVDAVTPFVSDTPDRIHLFIEFRPPEGPLFADTGLTIDGNRLDEVKLELQRNLGSDLWGIKGDVVEKITIRRGVIS